ncbi:MAG: hypothetical protein PWP03_661 [Candidatus Woesearchaeota archaeon]|nr:hypothetical protein [Candidatus Woesearchaeota archaeon]MDN5328023.1 hypothetical protein [Candidatus Woesearchaeota archaeon]
MQMKSKDMEKSIREALDKNKLIFGFNKVHEAVVGGNATAVIVSSTCEESRKNVLKQLCDLAKIDFIESNLNSKELGILCRRQHNVATVVITK